MEVGRKLFGSVVLLTCDHKYMGLIKAEKQPKY